MDLNVIFEDNHLIVINKQAGTLVQGDETGDEPLNDLVKSYIKTKYNKPGDVFLGTVHRLDRPTSGIVLFAKTSKALTRMNELFKTKDIQKTYWAITEKEPSKKNGVCVDYLLKNEKQNKSFVKTEKTPGAKRAELSYRLIGKGENYSFIEVNPATGRHHQIRVQLSTIGCIIKGDLKYGAKRSNKDGSISLHARKLVFKHPVKEEMVEIIANPPDDPVWNAFLKFSLSHSV
jgi:23S rRNA pseudouridine1911/1915/1917 synthase